jgi:hypothetical protein
MQSVTSQTYVVFSHHLLVPFSYVLVLFPKFLEILEENEFYYF